MSPQIRVLDLEPSPRAASQARRWLGQACQDLGRADLVECAGLGITELVSNAVIHAVPPFSVVIRGTSTHPRVDVHDGLSTLPEPPALDPRPGERSGEDSSEDSGEDSGGGDDEADFLATFGRGLAIVARSSVAWGARVEEHGKVVWFEPAGGLRDEVTRPHLDTRLVPQQAVRAGQVQVRLLGLDPDLHRSVTMHSHELRRELRLLALAHAADYPVAASLSATWHEIERLLRQEPWNLVSFAQDAGLERTDVVVTVPPGTGSTFARMTDMLDLADEFCRDEKLLALQRSPRQRSYHQWLLGEFVRQLAGAEPRPWHASEAPAGARAQ